MNAAVTNLFSLLPNDAYFGRCTKLRDQAAEYGVVMELTEFDLKKTPLSLEVFGSVFVHDDRTIVWISGCIMITKGWDMFNQAICVGCLSSPFYVNFGFSLEHCHNQVKEAIDFLLSLYNPSTMNHVYVGSLADAIDCPISEYGLKRLVQCRHVVLVRMNFVESQSRILADPDAVRAVDSAFLSFLECTSLRGFEEACMEADFSSLMPLRVHFVGTIPLAAEGLAQLVLSRRLCGFWFCNVELPLQFVHVLTEADHLRELSMESCSVQGSSLGAFSVQVAARQRGLKYFAFDFHHEDWRNSNTQWDTVFWDALGSKGCHLECIRLVKLDDESRYDEFFWFGLLTALKKNTRLRAISFEFIDPDYCKEIIPRVLETTIDHPTLFQLQFDVLPIFQREEPRRYLHTPQDFCEKVARIFQKNHQIEEIEFCSTGFKDRKLWNELVAPCLTANKFRKRFVSLTASSVSGPALLGETLARVTPDPMLAYMALTRYQDTVAISVATYEG